MLRLKILYFKEHIYNMEDTTIQYLKKPNLKGDKLPYVNNNKEIYVNLFKIIIKKPLTLYEYPYSVVPEIEPGDFRIRSKLFKHCKIEEGNKKKYIIKPKNIYGECFVFGDILYGMKEVNEAKTFNCKLYSGGMTEYTITFEPKRQKRTINQEDLKKDSLTKQFIEVLIRDILHANPNLEFYKGLFVKKNDKKVLKTKNETSIYFYPGYTTSFMETEGGNYLNVTLKNKILSESILKFLEKNNYKDSRNQEKIRDLLIGRTFKVSYSKRHYIIDDILFDRNPANQNFERDKKTVLLKDYYKERYSITINNLKQPLLVVRRKNGEMVVNLFFIPELCNFAGLDDEFLKDREFMKNLAKYTKLTPQDRINKTNEFLQLLVETERKKEEDEEEKPNSKDNKRAKIKICEDDKLSSKEKSDLYGIEVKALDQAHKAYYMKETILIGAENKPVKVNKPFNLLSKKDMTNWLCLYRESNYNDADYLYKSLNKASRGYGLDISEPEWVEMGDRAQAHNWIKKVEDYFGEKKKKAKKNINLLYFC